MDPNPSDSAVERANADFAGNAFSADSAAIDPKLVALTGRATVLYARKAYDEAAEVYAEACTLQEKLNGELAPENAELLYAYGRCLYHVAVSKSDVLGGKGVVEEFVPQPSKKRKATDVDLDTQEGESSTKSAPKKFKVERAAHFEITGDDNEWTESDDSDVANAEAQDQIADEQEDDFGIAWEILDMARCILVKRLEDHKTVPHDGEGKGKAKAEVSSEVRKEKEMLADTLDLQAEIALENERFLDAVGNSRESLALQQQLFPEDSNRIAEAHFKLSLALEFASVTQPRTQDDQSPKGDFLRLHNDAPGVDEAMRKDAAKEMQLSIVSTKLRLVREEESLARLPEGEASRNKKSQIEDVRGMLEEMEQRLLDLRSPAISLSGPSSADLNNQKYSSNDIRELWGTVMEGLEGTASEAGFDMATKSVNDLTGFVRKKEKKSTIGAVVSNKNDKGKSDSDTSGSAPSTSMGTSDDGAGAKLEQKP